MLLMVLCLALIAVLAVAQVAHLHLSQTEADHCPLCITLQSAVPLAMATLLVVLVTFGTPVKLVEQRVAARTVASWHYSRPPPAQR